MLKSSVCALVLAVAALSSIRAQAPSTPGSGMEKHLANIKQLTFGGENAEAYFSADGTRLIFQSTRAGYPCDQIYTMKVDGSDERRVSNGTGRTTCGYFYPGGKSILFASTHEASKDVRRGRATRVVTCGRSTTATTSTAPTPTARRRRS